MRLHSFPPPDHHRRRRSLPVPPHSRWSLMDSGPPAGAHHNNKEKLLVIMGATGAGKSRLLLDLAARCISAEIVNSDKMQVYCGLDIPTNKLPVADRRGVPHHLLGELDLLAYDGCDFSPADFRARAGDVISEIWSREKVPMLVGGSYSFIHALLVENKTVQESSQKETQNFLGDIRGPTLAFLPELALEGETRRNIPKFQGIYQSICRPSFYVGKHTTVEEILKLRFGPDGEDPRENNNQLIQTNGQAPTEPVEDTEDDEEEPEGGREDDLAEAEVNADGLLPVYRYTSAPDQSRLLLGRVDHRGCNSDRPAEELDDRMKELLAIHEQDGGLVGYDTPTLDQYRVVYYTDYTEDQVIALSCPQLLLDWDSFLELVHGVFAFDDDPGEMVVRLPSI